MANPNHQALRQAAAQMRSEAKTERQLMVEKMAERDAELGTANNQARQRHEAAEAALKSAEGTQLDERNAERELRQGARAELDDAAAADKAGNPAKAEEHREWAGRMNAKADGAAAKLEQADRDVAAARLEVAESRNQYDLASENLRKMNFESSNTEQALDSLENKARLYDEAGTKYALAETTDNVVERAELELAAEKLYRDGNAIEVDETAISRFTGRDVELPDPAAFASDDTTAAETSSTSSTAETDLLGVDAMASVDFDAIMAPADDGGESSESLEHEPAGSSLDLGGGEDTALVASAEPDVEMEMPADDAFASSDMGMSVDVGAAESSGDSMVGDTMFE